MAKRTAVPKVDGTDNAEVNERKTRVQLDHNLLVPCMNVTLGELTYVSRKTQAEYAWTEHGDIQDIELGELVNMRASSPRFINEPWIYILDDEVVEYLHLTDLYTKIIKPDEVEALLKKNEKTIKDRVSKAPHGSRELVIHKARELSLAGVITVGTQRVIEEVTKAKLDPEADAI